MGIDIYLRWSGFGIEKLTNPNYKKQITGFADNGKDGYLRIAYSDPNYEAVSNILFWDWDKNVIFTNSIIKKFIELINNSEMEEERKKEWLDFAEFGKKLNSQHKLPKIHISY
jgi:hypothetical protein